MTIVDDALDAYSRVVTSVAERLTPSVASLQVRGRAEEKGVRLDVRLSPTGGLSGEADSEIRFSLPQGTTFSGFSGTVRRGSETLGACDSPVGTTVTCKVSGGEGKVGGTVTFTFSEANGTINTQSVKTT